ncbi:MAG TPA: hypothetical protein VF473_08115, partial [Cyclobacteriaceae bacterium]
QGKYNSILAMWALENNEPERAVVYIDYAVSQRGDSITRVWANQLYSELGKNPSLFNSGENQKPADVTGKNKKYKIYADAMAAETAGDSAKAAVYYTWLGNADPFFDEGVIAAANYFKKNGHTSYNILAEAMLYHPSSMRIREAYALEAARVGFEDYAMNALAVLKTKLSAKEYSELSQKVNALLAVER